jgi:hypothetical protein
MTAPTVYQNPTPPNPIIPTITMDKKVKTRDNTQGIYIDAIDTPENRGTNGKVKVVP